MATCYAASMSIRIEQQGDDVLLWVKAVPGASRNQIAGLLGDRLKVLVSAPPEGGKANKAICKLLARILGVKFKDVSIESGQTNPEKIIRIKEYTVQAVQIAIG